MALIKRRQIMEQNRVYNFSAGPSMLPEEVLKEVQRDMLNYADSGMSIHNIPVGFKSILNSKQCVGVVTKTAPQNILDFLHLYY